MGRRFKLKKLEERHGNLERVILTALDRNGGEQTAAARELGVAQATLSRWLKENDYVAIIRYVKKGETA